MANIIDSIDYVEADYQHVTKDSRFSSNQVRTRPSSFEWIATRFRNWRISRLNQKLEKQKEKLLREQFRADDEGMLTKGAVNKLNRKTQVIANLEEKINFLSTNVDSRYFIGSRAIKLRNKMFANFQMNSRNAYSVGEENYDAVFGESQVVDFEPKEDTAMAFVASEVMPSVNDEQGLSQEEVKDVIDSHLDQIQATEMSDLPPGEVAPVIPAVPVTEEVKNEEGLSQEEVKDVIDGQLDQVQATEMGALPPVEAAPVIPAVEDVPVVPSTPVTEEVKNEESLSQEEVKDVIDGQLDQVQATEMGALPPVEVAPVIPAVEDTVLPVSDEASEVKVIIPISPSAELEDESAHIQDEIDDVFKNVDSVLNGNSQEDNTEQASNDPVEDTTDEVKDVVSEEWSSLTDEEIAKSKADLENNPVKSSVTEEEIDTDFENYRPTFDLVDNLHRDEVVVVPEREEETKVLALEPGAEQVPALPPAEVEDKVDENLHFDYSDATFGDIAKNLGDKSSLEDFKAARRRVEELKRRQKETADAKARAEKEAHEAAVRAEEARRLAEERQAVVNEKMAKLLDYEGALKEDCEFNESRTAAAHEAAEASMRIVEEQEAEVRGADDLIAEIDSVIAPEAVNVVAKGK